MMPKIGMTIHDSFAAESTNANDNLLKRPRVRLHSM